MLSFVADGGWRLSSRILPHSVSPRATRRRTGQSAESDMKGTARDPARRAEATPRGAPVDEWLASLSGQGALGALLSPSPEEQVRRGYGHTLREIAQQPVTWIETAVRMRGLAPSGRGEPRRRRRRRLHRLGELDLRRGVRGPVPAARSRRSRLGRAGGPHPDPPGDLPAPDRPVPRGLARPLGQQPREPRRRGLAAREPSPGPAPLHHLQPRRRPRHVLPGPPRRPDDRPRREDGRPQPRDDQQLHEPGPRRARPRRRIPRPARRAPSGSRGPPPPCCRSGPTPSPRPRGAASARSSTSAAAAASAPPARPRSRCWR